MGSSLRSVEAWCCRHRYSTRVHAPVIEDAEVRLGSRSFKSIGAFDWWDPIDVVLWTDGSSTFTVFLERAGLPGHSESLSEYWLFCCRVSGADWKIDGVVVDNKRIDSGGRLPAYVVATRTRSIIKQFVENTAAVSTAPSSTDPVPDRLTV